jgi:DNA-binding NtrC family response regulator
MGRIAFVDDAADVLEMYDFLLKGQHQIRTFSRPQDFLTEFRPGSFDLIVLDIVMPEMDGFEVLRGIRERDEHVPVVAMTGQADSNHREKALKAGFCDYFVKPILSMDYFRKAVENHLGDSRKRPH